MEREQGQAPIGSRPELHGQVVGPADTRGSARPAARTDGGRPPRANRPGEAMSNGMIMPDGANAAPTNGQRSGPGVRNRLRRRPAARWRRPGPARPGSRRRPGATKE
ncbi:hypothetical protein GCM10018781_58270 [Kitasatospora indigofera]|uniref:Uncharacterized protein n=1 Tax=Kitasatospora indigofera TaxID=67307 RepID=A0A919G953_9ACTN|nr:hypothetical protein GCM10018781_58270 [Kitasatospora indigofera]